MPVTPRVIPKAPAFRAAGRLRRPVAWRLAIIVAAGLALTACVGDRPHLSGDGQQVADNGDTEAVIRLADDLRQRGELATAIVLYRRAATVSGDADDLVRLGRALAEATAHDHATTAFRRALAQEPGRVDALLGLGTSYLALGDVDKSIQHLEQLADQGGQQAGRAYAALGAALDIAGRHEQALEAYAAGLNLASDDLSLKSNLALSFAFHDRHVEAIALMREVTDALDAGRSHHRNLVLVLTLAGQDRQAVAEGVRLLGDSETRDVMAKATSLRRLPPGVDRARAVGLS